jgi:ABC-type antimicrobial peptide transport system permease subunit
VLRQSTTLTAVGIVMGLLAASGLTRYLSGMLFEMTPLDPITFGLAGLAFAGLAGIAALVPTRRATRIDPTTALRCE